MVRFKTRSRLLSESGRCDEVVPDDRTTECVRGDETESLKGRVKMSPETDELLAKSDESMYACEKMERRGSVVKCRTGKLAYRWVDIPVSDIRAISDRHTH